MLSTMYLPRPTRSKVQSEHSEAEASELQGYVCALDFQCRTKCANLYVPLQCVA